MLEEFKTGLLKGCHPADIAKRLTEELKSETQRREKEIKASGRTAEYIWLGMAEPEGSEPYKIALSYLEEYSHQTGQCISDYYQNRRQLAESLADGGGIP